MRGDGLEDLAGDAEAAEVTLAGPDLEDHRRHRGRQVLRVAETDDGVGVAVPPVHRDGDLGRVESPVATEQDGIVDERVALAPRPADQVAEEHLLDAVGGEHLAVALGHQLRRLRIDRAGDG